MSEQQEPTGSTEESVFSPVEELIAEIRAGKMIVLCDEEDRENEGDLVVAAEHITPEMVNFIVKYARGVVCVAMDGESCDRLALDLQTSHNNSHHNTAFTVTVDAAEGITTGVSAADRAHTIKICADPESRPEELVRPGHINPLRALDGGVLVRAGQTEGSVDLCKLAELRPCAVICEIMNDDGSMARVPDLVEFCRRHDMKMGSVPDIIRYRRQNEVHVRHAAQLDFPTRYGAFDLHVFMSDYDDRPHLAICLGGVGAIDEDTGEIPPTDEPVLLRVHSECLTGDVLGSLRCDCGPQLDRALSMIAEQGRGVLLYMRQEGRGIGLKKKLEAYALQDKGYDTVEANELLGFGADMRDYGVGAQIIAKLGVRKIRLMTNNPRKIIGLEGFGLEIVERVPIEIPANDANRRYLETKRDKLGHLLKGI